ncbi:MAG TPA: N-acetyltransferase [Phycisphaerales bacterium]|nr:N-acetyltransferase [Phycisphaerales bacterium]
MQLRPVELADLPALYTHQADPEAIRMAVVNPRDPDAFDRHWRTVLTNPEVHARAIIADGVLVGSVNAFKLEGRDTVGYWIAREHWNRGIATRALALLLQEVPVRPLHATAARTNTASIRVLERCGFRITGHTLSPRCDRYPECETTHLVLDPQHRAE